MIAPGCDLVGRQLQVLLVLALVSVVLMRPGRRPGLGVYVLTREEGTIALKPNVDSDRQKKLAILSKHGIPAYADRYQCTETVLSAMSLPDGDFARIAGRVMAIRDFGGMAFLDLQDRSAKGQISFRKGGTSETAEWLRQSVLDVGDFVGVEGHMYTTKSGERTLDVQDMEFLSKAIRPLPDKWHGVRNREVRYRKRYLDLTMSRETREVFATRASVISSMRQFLEARGFMEVETPILQAASSGAAARPFITHHNALAEDFYLRISPETYLKRLVAGGIERVYEIGKNFRNEGLDPTHLQEFTMIEWYAAYWSYQDNMVLVKELIQHVLRETLGTTTVQFQGSILNFGGEWQKIDYCDALREATDIDILAYETRDELAKAVKGSKAEVDADRYPSLPALIDALYKTTVRPSLVQPTFLLNHPTVLVPLARRNSDRPEILDMFQVVVNTREIVKAYSELVDPVDQRARMLGQLAYREQGDDETMMLEEDYIECMEYGMPPISGLGLGVDRLVALMTDVDSLRDVVFFSMMRRARIASADGAIKP